MLLLMLQSLGGCLAARCRSAGVVGCLQMLHFPRWVRCGWLRRPCPHTCC